MSDTTPVEGLVEKALENVELPPRDLTKERDLKCVPIAQEIVKIIGEQVLPLGDITEEQRKEYFPITKKVLELLLAKGATLGEVNYIMKMVMQCSDMIQNIVIASLNDNLKRAELKKWGSKLDDLTLQKLDDALKLD